MADLLQQLLPQLVSDTATTDGIISTLETIAGTDVAFNGPLRTRLANTIFTTMQSHHMVEGVQEEACLTLGILAFNHADIQRSISQHLGGIGTIVSAMQNHETAEGVQHRACCLLRILANSGGDFTTLIAQHGGIDAIFAAMQKHPMVECVQEVACDALFALKFNDENRKSIVPKGGIDTLLSVIRNHPTIQQLACGVLLMLSEESADIRKAITDKGGAKVERAMQMQKFNLTSIFQSRKGMALALLTKGRDAMDPASRLRRQLGSDTTQRGIISALKLFLHRVHLHFRASSFPLKLDTGTAIYAVVAAMQNHEAVKGVQKRGCSALEFLIGISYYTTLSVEQGVAIARAVLKAMRNHLLIAGVQEGACRTLRVLLGSNTDIRDIRTLIIQERGIDSIVTAMQNHGMVAVQYSACGALRMLAKNKNSSMLIVEKGGIDVILAAMRNNRMTEALQEEVCATLRRLAGNESNRKAIKAKGGIEALGLFMQSHPGLAYMGQEAINRIQMES